MHPVCRSKHNREQCFRELMGATCKPYGSHGQREVIFACKIGLDWIASHALAARIPATKTHPPPPGRGSLGARAPASTSAPVGHTNKDESQPAQCKGGRGGTGGEHNNGQSEVGSAMGKSTQPVSVHVCRDKDGRTRSMTGEHAALIDEVVYGVMRTGLCMA